MEVATEEVPKENTENIESQNTTTDEHTPTPPPQDPPRKSKKDDRTSKKEDKNVEQFMKSLNSVPSMEEKLSLVCKKYVQTADDNKKLQFYIKQSDKRYALLLKEKDQLQHEYNKTILVKSKLENLCRELQKHNKAIKEESLLKIREEEERRKETQAKFQSTLSEITTLLHQNNEKNAKLQDDNISMTEKFKSVVQQYQLREQQVDKMAKQMALESQLSDAKMQKASLEHQAERERLLAEMEQLKVSLAQYRAKIIELQRTKTNLEGQVAVYTHNIDEFKNTLVKSNQVFGGFKEQMEKMSKKILKLEKESLSWKSRWETSQTALLDMCGERQAGEERAAAAARHLHHMQGLCRTLQAERTVLVNTLKEHNIERPPLPALPPMPAPPPPAPASNAKVDAMAANCAQLRQSLAHLQTQLNTLTNKKEESAKQEKPEKSKKSKSKKNKADKQKANQEKAEVKDAEHETTAKDAERSSEETQPNVEEIKVENEQESPEDKMLRETKAMESLLQAINMANICDLEVVNDDLKQNGDIDAAIVTEILDAEEEIENSIRIEELKSEQIEENDSKKIKEAPKEPEVITKEVSEIEANDSIVSTKELGSNNEVTDTVKENVEEKAVSSES